MSCEYPVLCPRCGGSGHEQDDRALLHPKAIDCELCKADGEVCPTKRDAYRAEHGPDA